MKAEEVMELEPIFTIAIDLHAALYALISGTLITSFLVRRLQRSPPDGHSALFCGLQCGSTTAIDVLLVTTTCLFTNSCLRETEFSNAKDEKLNPLLSSQCIFSIPRLRKSLLS